MAGFSSLAQAIFSLKARFKVSQRDEAEFIDLAMRLFEFFLSEKLVDESCCIHFNF